MKYETSKAFRQALETRLNAISKQDNISIVRIRKVVAFERLIHRLLTVQPGSWILKGGLGMQLRLGVLSRTTKDIDLLVKGLSIDVYDELVEAADYDADDWFIFSIGKAVNEPDEEFGGYRFPVECHLAGRLFEKFHLDIGLSDIVIGKFDHLEFEKILHFADFPPTRVPCYPVPQQIAEKLHALTRAYATGTSTRAKDLVDILLLAGLSDIDGKVLKQSIHATFNHRNTHPVPDVLPAFSSSMRREYNRIVREHSLNLPAYDAALEALAEFINPVLQNQNPGNWYPTRWTWE